MIIRTVFFALTGLTLVGGAVAQSIKPGLWEINHRVQTSGGEMEKAMAEAQKQIAALPADQQKMMRDMMARQGVGMSGGAGNAITVKVCLTKEMVERNEFGAQQGDCQQVMAPRVGNSMKFSFTCAKPPSSGEGQVSFNGSESYTLNMTTSTKVQGRAQTMQMDGGGKWLGAECGNIKPLAAPRK